ncbi:MAG TPA: outer membrane beta-barrel protein [Pyrinomonadaceae bacterium]|nr:outer membrane beta-barrel protein [Pyrinomonadaceae bacterium]
MFKTLMMTLVIVASASIAAAQSDYKRFEFFGGYSHNRIDTGIGDDDPDLGDIIDEREGFNGFNASVTGNLSRYFGLKFDVSGHYKSRTVPLFSIASPTPNGSVDINSSVYNFLGGVQLKDNSTESTFKPFAHALVGAAHGRNRVEFNNIACVAIFPSPCSDFTASDTGFAGAFGGGIDIRASNSIDIRVIQVDYNPTRLFDSTQHNFRIGVGVVFH